MRAWLESNRERSICRTEVTHGATDVSGMEGPTEGLGLCIRGIEDAGNVLHGDDATSLPFLNRKVLDVDMTGASSRLVFVDHHDCREVVLIEDRRGRLSEAELGENRPEILGYFGSSDGGNEFSFGGAEGNGGLELGLESNSTTCKSEDIAGDGATVGAVGSVGGIDKSGEFKRSRDGKARESRIE